MPRRMHPKFGPVYEREFSAPRVDAGTRNLLEDFKGRGVICDYDHAEDMLKVWRPWVDGQTQDEVFSGLSVKDRIKNSRQLFRFVHDKLEQDEDGHGALHPRNIILRHCGGFELVDAIFNRTCLRGNASRKENDLWLWGPCIPVGWSINKWDRISLLRTAALLAQDPSDWVKSRSSAEIADLCHGWAENLLASVPPSADFAVKVRDAISLLPEILGATFIQRGDCPGAVPELPRNINSRSQEEVKTEESILVESDEALRLKIRKLLCAAHRSIVRGRPEEALGYVEEIFN